MRTAALSEIGWITAFLDLAPSEGAEETVRWAELTGSTASASRGERGEFATLSPPSGAAYLRVQRLAEGASRIHLDLHAADPAALVARAAALGAEVLAEPAYAVLCSPGGLVFCVVSAALAHRPPPITWPGGHTSLLDQICLDIPPDAWTTESAFWRDLTGWELRTGSRPEFSVLVRPEGQPLRLMLQRLQTTDSPVVTAHPDWATTSRAAETARQEALGAVVVEIEVHWTVLRLGSLIACITDRDPMTGTLS